MRNSQLNEMRTHTLIGARRFAYLAKGAAPASVAAGLLVAGILAMMMTLQ